MIKYIIKDWTGNVLDFKEKFKLPQLAIPMTFESFEEAEEHLVFRLDDHYDNERGEYYIEELSNQPIT